MAPKIRIKIRIILSKYVYAKNNNWEKNYGFSKMYLFSGKMRIYKKNYA